VTIIIEACHSGDFINTNDGKPTALVGANRTIIVSARGDKQAKILPNRSSFTKAFFDRIDANKPVAEAFRDALVYMERTPFHRDQYPQMDADGDGKINTPLDYAEVAHRYLPADLVSLGHPPEIVDITGSQTLPEGVSSLRISTKLLGVSITRVFATIIPPGYDPSREMDDWSALRFPELDLAKVSDEGSKQEYAADYVSFTQAGDYIVIVSAENADGSAAPVQTTITVPKQVITRGDVNGDGRIDSRDAILVSQFASGIKTPTEAQKASADMNGDGKVDSKDTILILRKSAGYAAPIIQPGGFVASRESALLQNYPNPFNPETWIPYILKESGEVTIRIYSMNGLLIRELRPGYKPAGSYVNQSSAAYWDGKDESGERVSGGVYFYTIHSGDFTAVKKMMVVE
jgi:hypothetical protein